MINELSPKTQTITINKPKNQAIFIDQTTSKSVAVTIPNQTTISKTTPPKEEIIVDSEEGKDMAVVSSVLRGEKGEKGDPGVGLQYEWVGSKLGIKTEAESDFEYVNLVAASGDTAYTHYQGSASREWQICHNLGKYPSVTVVDSAGTVVLGDITYLNTEELIIHFTSEFSGKAFLN